MSLPPGNKRTEHGAIMPSASGLDAATLRSLREEGKNNLFFFAKGILGYGDMTKRVHQEFCEWMQGDQKRALGLMPRGHFKTTIEMADIIRRLLINPEERILLCSESAENAEYMLREIQEHIKNNELLRTVYPEIIPKQTGTRLWNKQSIILPRKGTYREPSIDTAGITTKIVSRHYTRIYCDDLVSNEAMESPSVMRKSIEFVNRLVSLLVNQREHTIRIIGTRWAYHDIYSHIIDNFKSYDTFIRKAIVRTADGSVEPFFPERWTMGMFEEMIQTDPYQWATQMANEPLDTAVVDFKMSWLQYFSIGPDYDFRFQGDDGLLHLQSQQELTYYIHVDPSMGESLESDYSGIVVVAVNPLDMIFIVEAIGVRLDPLATAEKILELHARYLPRLVTIESNAYQKSLLYYVQKEARRRNTYVRLEPFLAPSRKSKAARIRGALQPLFATQRVWIRKGLVDLVNEYMHFGRGEHQHILDALAQGPEYWRTPKSSNARKAERKRSKVLVANRGLSGYGL